jgi:hypothetical protein
MVEHVRSRLVIEPPAVLNAHLDETAAVMPNGQLLYGLAAVLTSPADEAVFAAELDKLLLPDRTFLRYHDETTDRRLLIAQAVATLPMAGGIVVTRVTAGAQQERARARLLAALLPRLEHAERVTHVVIESRAGSDKLDRRTRDRLRRSHQISTALRVDHVRKHVDARLWLADFRAGAYVGAELHAEAEPWDVAAAAHAIEVVTVP